MIPPLRSSIEPLEDRIAPALLVNGANLIGGAGNPTTGETSVGNNSVTLVKVLAGQALVWFDNGVISSISFGPNTSLEVTGDIFGDLVGNLTAAGTLSDSDNDPTNGEDGSKLLANSLIGLKTFPLGGNVQKGSLDNIITGGSVSNLTVAGQIFGVYAGDSVFRAESDLLSGGHVTSSTGTIDINPVAPLQQTTYDFTKTGSVFQAGASVRAAKITFAPGLQVFAGSGNPTGLVQTTNPGLAGGSVSNITIESAVVPTGSPVDTPSYALLAGDGADGKTGGAGGSVDHILEKASFGPVVVTGGKGGDGAVGAGGVGGSISFLDLQSNSSHYIVTAGNGGDGAPGGDGGKLVYNNFTNRTPVSGVIKAADFTGDGLDDILVIDAATGQMIINTQQGGNANSPFHELVQYVDSSLTSISLIDPKGVSPTDAVVMDVNNDGLLDIVVAYKNSASLGAFLNQGGGSFYDAANSDFASTSFGLTFAPVKIATDGFVIAIGENSGGKGIMRYGVAGGTSIDDLEFTLSAGSNEFGQPIADIVESGGSFITGFTSGAISILHPQGLLVKKAFQETKTSIAITGGITDLELDSTGDRLLALSDVGRSVTLFNVSGSGLTPLQAIALSPAAQPLVAHFVHDVDSTTEDDIAVLGSLPTGSTLTTYSSLSDGDPQTFDPYSLDTNFNTTKVFKNFAAAYGPAGLIGDVALAGSMNSFTVTPDLVTTAEYPLPFASKIIEATAGDGGNGLNIGKTIGKGGAGGGIIGINADSNQIKLKAGTGGDAASGAGGAGGSVINPASFILASGATVIPTLTADVVLEITAGDGGTPNGPVAKTASGGAGGSLNGLIITLAAGDITLTTGIGGDGNGGAGGAGGSFIGTKTIGHDGNLSLTTGHGGEALSGAVAGGAGGSITGFSHVLDLDPDTERLEKPYTVTVLTGDGGNSAGGAGGAGGSVVSMTLTLDGSDRTYDDLLANPPLQDAHRDSTVRISVTTGIGGDGTTGGAGGNIRDFSHTSVFDQTSRFGIFLNYVVANLQAGYGGDGSAGNGGAGGAIQFARPISGITYFDPDAPDTNRVPFLATAGDGGDGSVKGGAGGAVTGLRLQNSAFSDGRPLTTTHLDSAVIKAGKGGDGGTSDGGVGGAVSGALIGVQTQSADGGFLRITAGDGGNGGTAGKGGAGGAITTSTLGVVSTLSSVGMLLTAGDGGQGSVGGGVGGALSSLQLSTPQSTVDLSAILYSGDGGKNLTSKGTGGKGGDILNITQGQDVNSSLNLIQAGKGGDNPVGTAGAGGNINGIKSVGFIGRRSGPNGFLGVFDQVDLGNGIIEIPQGLFSGRGGDGLVDGINGAVTNVTARQIAAIAAAVDSNGLFAAASKVASVKASLIGFDKGLDGVFTSTVPGTPNPALSKPIDGFIMSAIPLTQVVGLPASTTFVFIG